MSPFNSTEELRDFIEKIRKFFSHETESSVDLILALATNHFTRARSVAELSLSKHFKKEFSSLYRAVHGYYAPRAEKNNREQKRQRARAVISEFLLCHALSPHKEIYRFFLDMTGNIKKHSPKTPDRSYIYSNGNVEVGHLYSAVCLGGGDGWMLPLSMERIPSSKNKIEFSVSQIVRIVEKVPAKSLSICVGDAGYCCNKFLQPLSSHQNVVTITRARSNKVMFSRHKDIKKGAGKKRVYGKKHHLTKGSLPSPYAVEGFEEKTKKGKLQSVKISIYKNHICRGSKNYKMSDVPVDFVRVEIYKPNGVKKYARDLWLQVVGERKEQLSLKCAYEAYKERFDIEHLFKFGKSKLLMNKYQTTDPQAEEDFMLFGMIAYHLLYYCKTLLNKVVLRKWENKKKESVQSPWKVYRAAGNSNIFDAIETMPLKKRGIPTYKNIRKIFTQSSDQPIVRKPIGQPKLEILIKSRFENSISFSKASVNIDASSKDLPLEQIAKKAQEACIKVWAQGG